jgi:hypothetical protein
VHAAEGIRCATGQSGNVDDGIIPSAIDADLRPLNCVPVLLPYNSCMENNHWFRNDQYETGVWVLLIVVAAGILGLIFWLGYELLL